MSIPTIELTIMQAPVQGGDRFLEPGWTVEYGGDIAEVSDEFLRMVGVNPLHFPYGLWGRCIDRERQTFGLYRTIRATKEKP